MKTRVDEQYEAILRQHMKVKPEFVFQDDTVLGDVGLDSLTAVDVMLSLEDTFGVTFPDHLLTYDVFRHFASLRDAVQGLVEEN
ncbi:MAG: phosphopantetheine-binding protein [Acidobacteriota bacterium]